MEDIKKYSGTLSKEVEKWWKHLDNPMHVMESLDDIIIEGTTFRAWGDKYLWTTKTKRTMTYMRTFQSQEQIVNSNYETVYPTLDIYVDICNGNKRTSYKKVRCRLSC